MDLTSILIQAASGAVGGQVANTATKNSALGGIGNILAGALGGGLGGPVLGSLLGLGGAAATSGIDLQAGASGVATGGVSGALTALALGYVKAKFL